MTYRTLRLAAWLAAPLLAALVFHSWLASRDEQRRLRATLAAQQQLLDAADARERARQSALDDTLKQIEKLKRSTQTPEQVIRELPNYLPLPQPITLGGRSFLAPSGAEGSSDIKDGRAALSRPVISAVEGQDFSPADSKTRTARTSAQFHPQRVVEFGRDGAVSATQELGQGTNASEKSPSAPDVLPSPPAAQIPAEDLKPLFDFVQNCRACQAQLAVAQQSAADDAGKIAALTRERDAAITAAHGGTFWRRLRRNAMWFAIGAGAGAAAGFAASR